MCDVTFLQKNCVLFLVRSMSLFFFLFLVAEGRKEPFFFVSENKEDLFSFRLKKVKKVDDVALPQPSFRRERKKKIR